MFEFEVFWKQRHCIEESTVLVTLLGLFGAPAIIRRPQSGSAPGELCPLCPPSLPCMNVKVLSFGNFMFALQKRHLNYALW